MTSTEKAARYLAFFESCKRPPDSLMQILKKVQNDDAGARRIATVEGVLILSGAFTLEEIKNEEI